MAHGESKSGLKRPRKITPRLRRTLIGHGGAEHAVKGRKEIRPGSRNRTARGNSRSGLKEPKWVLTNHEGTEKARNVENDRTDMSNSSGD